MALRKALHPFLPALVMLVVGVSAGIWIDQNYEISVQRRPPLAAGGEVRPKGGGYPDRPDDGWGGTVSPSVPSDYRDADAVQDAGQWEWEHPYADNPDWITTDGPFRFVFTEGERLTYRLSTAVGGFGEEDIGVSPIDLSMESWMTLDTLSVDERGVGELRFGFDKVSSRGNFMDAAHRMDYEQGEASFREGHRQPLDTRNGIGSLEGIPQLEFFNDPVTMRVAPNGEILALKGGRGLASMFGAAPKLATVEFPDGPVNQYDQWESTFALPVPGFQTPAKARIRNTFAGYETVAGRVCGVIDQEFISEQADGVVDSPESAFGEAMKFSMPEFLLSGSNRVFFDVTNGQLVRSDLDLNLTMTLDKMAESGGEVGQMLTEAASIFGKLAQGIDELTGADSDPGGSPKPLLQMDVAIQGTMELVSTSLPDGGRTTAPETLPDPEPPRRAGWVPGAP